MLLSFSELDVLIYQGKVGGYFMKEKTKGLLQTLIPETSHHQAVMNMIQFYHFNLFVIMEKK